VAEPRKDREWLAAQSTLLKALMAHQQGQSTAFVFAYRGIRYQCLTRADGLFVTPIIEKGRG